VGVVNLAKVVVFGIGQWASLAHFYLTHDSSHEVVAFTVDRDYLKTDKFQGLPVVAFDDVENLYPPEDFEMFLPISFKKMNHLRANKYHEAKSKGYRLVSYVSTKATVWPGFVPGDNCFILENSNILPFAKVGNDVFIMNGSLIGHHSVIKDHCSIAPHAVVLGCVTIEPYCFLGANSTIRDEVTIARECLIGAGALILEDTQKYGVYKGNPAKLMGIRSDEIKSISYKSPG